MRKYSKKQLEHMKYKPAFRKNKQRSGNLLSTVDLEEIQEDQRRLLRILERIEWGMGENIEHYDYEDY
jgi:hypothetical protein